MSNVYFVKITSASALVGNIFSVVFECGEIARAAQPGQFVHIKCGDSRLLRRPISICSAAGDNVRIVFEAKGDGTKWLSERNPGETLDVLGPLGRGFTFTDGSIIVVGGGIGVPPMLFAAQAAKSDVTAILGFRTKSMVILRNEFKQACRDVTITTDDGSAGFHGMVTKPLEELLATHYYKAVLSCGPHNMQKAVAALCKHYKMPCQVSLEERMGCGVGACLVCACATVKNGHEEMSRVCADGPVFDAAAVKW